VSYTAASKVGTLHPAASLAAGTTYTATVKGGTSGVKDVAGNALAADKSWSFTTAASTPSTVTLVGVTATETNRDNNPAGMAEAFLNTATTSGTANKLFIFLDGTNTATQVVVGIYTNAAGDNPGTLLAQGTIASPTNGAWNSVTIPTTPIAAGTKYWIAVLGPAGGGTVQFRDGDSGGSAKVSAQTTLTTLPSTWTNGFDYPNSPMSAYAVQAP
jgi:hypothetical protein